MNVPTNSTMSLVRKGCWRSVVRSTLARICRAVSWVGCSPSPAAAALTPSESMAPPPLPRPSPASAATAMLPRTARGAPHYVRTCQREVPHGQDDALGSWEGARRPTADRDVHDDQPGRLAALDA